jgi:hypothetical protein
MTCRNDQPSPGSTFPHRAGGARTLPQHNRNRNLLTLEYFTVFRFGEKVDPMKESFCFPAE